MLSHEWEEKLKPFGLNEVQIARQDIQCTLKKPAGEIAFDTNLFNKWMGSLGENFEIQEGAEGFGRIRERATNRDVPWWATDNHFIRDFILWRYPTLKKQTGTQGKYGRAQICTARNRAARTVAIIYLSYRMGFFNYDIAELLGITEQAVDKDLGRIKQDAAEFVAAKRIVVKDVRVHSCKRRGVPVNGKLTKCSCKFYISHDEATQMVAQGAADWLWVYPPGKEPAFQTHGEIVMAQVHKTPRSSTIEKAHMERASEGKDQDNDLLSAYGELQLETWLALIKPYKPDPRPGMPVLTFWSDERTSN